MPKDLELILNNVLLALQVCLGVWQFTKVTPVGALIKGLVGWLLRPLGLSHTYSRLRCLHGRVFKDVYCFVLQPEIPSTRRNVQAGHQDSVSVRYLGEEFVLERRGSEGKMLFINDKMRYYIIPTVWKELQMLGEINVIDMIGYGFYPSCIPTRALPTAVVLKGQREFWEGVRSGGVMTFEEVLDGLILRNQHLSNRLTYHRLLPVDLSVSEEKLLKILNLFAVFLQTKKEKVHWLIPTSLSLSFISALLEFSTPVRVCLYTNINLLFCSIMHFICDPLPRSWRRQVYSLGNWVENLKPSNDIQLKIQRGNMRATIAGAAKVDNGQGATLVSWLNVPERESFRDIHCPSIHINIKCVYHPVFSICLIRAPSISDVNVECRSMEEYRHLITFVSLIANRGCGSLKSCGPNNKVSVRGFSESIVSYVESGFPPVYELELENVVLT